MGRGEFLEFDIEPAGLDGNDDKPVIRDEFYYLERAAQAMREGFPEPALRYYSRALSERLQIEEAWVGQCLALLDLGDCGEAVVWAERALKHCPGSGPLFAARAVALAREGMLEKALGFLDTALKVNKDHWLIWLSRGEVLTIMDKLASAEHCIGKAVEAGGESRWWMLRRAGEMLVLHDHPLKAVKYLIKAVELEPRVAVNQLRTAQAYYLLGRKKEAEYYLSRTMELRPDLHEAAALREDLKKFGLIKRLVAGLRRA